MQEALGETSAITSGMLPGEAEKTATEIKDTAMQRRSRDNFNQIFLSEAIKKQMMLWHSMNQQFLFTEDQQKIIRIVGKEAIRYFKRRGLSDFSADEQAQELLMSDELMGMDLNPKQFTTPMYPVETDEGVKPKFELEPGEEVGHLIITPEDISGVYDFIPDVESMELPTDQQKGLLKRQMLELARDPNTVGLLAQEGYKLKMKELLEDSMEDAGLQDADKYFEKQQQPINGPVDQAGGAGQTPGNPSQGNVPGGGMEQGASPMARAETQPVVPRPR